MVPNIEYSSFLVSLTETDIKTGKTKTIEKAWVKFPDPVSETISVIMTNFILRKALRADKRGFKDYHKYCYSWEENGKIYLNYIMGFVALPNELGVKLTTV